MQGFRPEADDGDRSEAVLPVHNPRVLVDRIDRTSGARTSLYLHREETGEQRSERRSEEIGGKLLQHERERESAVRDGIKLIILSIMNGRLNMLDGYSCSFLAV